MSYMAIVTKETMNLKPINWLHVKAIVRNLKRRILKATRGSNLKKVRSLKKLLIKSYSSFLLKVYSTFKDNKVRIISTFKEDIRSIIRRYRSGLIELLIVKLNKVIFDWVNNNPIFGLDILKALDNWIFGKLFKVAKRRHPKKTKGWCYRKYFGKFNPNRQDKSIFGNKETGSYVIKCRWLKNSNALKVFRRNKLELI